ncbi:MAG TPA: CHRD domain-containing protein [Candidatus Krumholzibacteria bacterium]|nr:CHRD domain-containing protein [Candidatus Krumholzibacteria bacterium]
MKTRILLTSLICLAATAALAETQFTATLDGASSGTPSPATGTAVMILNDAQTELSYTITYSGLTGTEVAAHFHNAPPGSNGPILEPLPAGEPKVGVWMVSPSDVVELMAGRVYINVHTNLYPAGEIRGNVTFDTVASEESSLSSVKTEYR